MGRAAAMHVAKSITTCFRLTYHHSYSGRHWRKAQNVKDGALLRRDSYCFALLCGNVLVEILPRYRLQTAASIAAPRAHRPTQRRKTILRTNVDIHSWDARNVRHSVPLTHALLWRQLIKPRIRPSKPLRWIYRPNVMSGPTIFGKVKQAYASRTAHQRANIIHSLLSRHTQNGHHLRLAAANPKLSPSSDAALLSRTPPDQSLLAVSPCRASADDPADKKV